MIQSPNRILAQLGHRYGRDLKLVQAAGGNVSVKASPHRMLIKASGARLREMTSAFGWAAADHQVIRTGLNRIAGLGTYRRREMAYIRLLRQATRSRGRRVSMEAGFHAILPGAYVLHLHSLAGILLGMMPQNEARRMTEKSLEDQAQVHFAPAKLPGFELTYRMRQGMSTNLRPPVQLWIQRNHGVVWSGPDKEELIRLVQRFERRLRSQFQLADYPVPHTAGSTGCYCKRRLPRTGYEIVRAVCFCRWPKCHFTLEPLFQDFVIYFNLWGRTEPDLMKTGPRGAVIGARTSPQWRDKKEVLYGHALVSTIARTHGWYQPLPHPMIGQLKAMETERLRMQQILSS